MKLVVVSKINLQTELLLSLIRRDVSRDCRLLTQGLPVKADPNTLYIFDMTAIDTATCASWLSFAQEDVNVRAVFINLPDDADVTRLVALPGIVGLFEQNTLSEHFINGLKGILNGSYWLTREVLCRHLENTRTPLHKNDSVNGIHLSPKERQILLLLTRGFSNDDIAQQLTISPHTVKTHFSNLYKKLNVRNRVQAATWAQNHPQTLTES